MLHIVAYADFFVKPCLNNLNEMLSSAPHNGRTQDGLQTPVPLAVGDEAIFPLLGISCFKIVVPTYYLVTLYSYCPPSIGRLVYL
jgi:hypothetical protein